MGSIDGSSNSIDSTHATFDSVVTASVALIGDGTGTGGNPISVENGGTQIEDDLRILNFGSGITATQNALNDTQVVQPTTRGIHWVRSCVYASVERLSYIVDRVRYPLN